MANSFINGFDIRILGKPAKRKTKNKVVTDATRFAINITRIPIGGRDGNSFGTTKSNSKLKSTLMRIFTVFNTTNVADLFSFLSRTNGIAQSTSKNIIQPVNITYHLLGDKSSPLIIPSYPNVVYRTNNVDVTNKKVKVVE